MRNYTYSCSADLNHSFSFAPKAEFMSTKPSLPRGTRDFTPEQMFRRNYIISKIKTIFERYGFQPLETPSMENLSVLTGKYGEEGDQLLFKILNSGDFLSKASPEDFTKGSRELTWKIAGKGLRYDLTVPFARYVVMHQNEITFPFKRYQIQPVWRADNPQKGRYREFYQCDADIIGTNSLVADLEFVWLIHDVFHSLGLEDFELKINNRKILTAISQYIGEAGKEGVLCVAIDKLDKIGKDAVIQELLNNGFESKSCDLLTPILEANGDNQSKMELIRSMIDEIDIGKEGLDEMEFILSKVRDKEDIKLKLDFDITLARGLSYYTGTIFEVKPTSVKMGSITGGGRYDDLTGIFGMKGTSGSGISFGIDRIYDVMLELGLFPESNLSATKVMVTNFDESTLPFALQTLNSLRTAGIHAEIYPDSAKMKKQFGYANKKGIPYVAIIGPDEAEKRLVSLKNMDSGEQDVLSLGEVTKKLIV